MKIGIFDSGIGGLLILQAIRQHLPEYDYEYFGDTKHVPYGDRSEVEIYELTKATVADLFSKDCALVVLACNTASAETLRKLQDEWLPEYHPDRKILGVIIPVIEEVVASSCSQVLLLGTKRTVGSGKYHIELGKHIHNSRNHIEIEAVATPELVPLLEADDIKQATEITVRYIDELIKRGDQVDGVILGCTHYNLMLAMLRQQYPQIMFFSQTEIIPTKLTDYLKRHKEIQTKLTKGATKSIFLSEERPKYDKYISTNL
jgi:glutamate racemase